MRYLTNVFLAFFILIGLVIFFFIAFQINKIIPFNSDFLINLSKVELSNNTDVSKIILPLLPPFGILLSALIASFSIMRTIENTNNIETIKNKNELDKYYVEKCTEGFKIVFGLLKDQNNNPSTWVEASRILKYTLDLSDNIDSKSYKSIYRIKEFQYRHLLLKTLSDEYGNSLKTTFFFGIKEWNSVDIETASRIAKQNNSSSGAIGLYDVTPYPKGAYIGKSSIKVIFDFIAYQDNFDDPLKDEKISNLEEWRDKGGISIIKEGAFKYLKFKEDEIKKIKEEYLNKNIV